MRHLAGQLRDIGLRIVDDGEPFLQLGQVFLRRFGRVAQRLADTPGHRFKALIDEPHHVALPRGEYLRHGLHAPGQLVLAGDQFAHPRLGLARTFCRRSQFAGAALAGTPGHDEPHHQQQRGKQRGAGQRLAERHGPAAEIEQGSGEQRRKFRLGILHAANLADSAREQNRNKPVRPIRRTA